MNQNNNNIFKIPDDLLLFLKNETYSLLIKGEPGIGKTALCMTILRELNIKNNFFYISTRVSPNKLFYYFKWINKYLKIKPSNTHIKSSKNENSFEPFFADARLDEPESLFERITNQLMDVRAPLIIVDSWDGIASFMDRESRLNNERVLQTWLERAGGRLILVGEGTGTSTLDYLVDGIITLKHKNYQGNELREIYLNKLRGINVIKKSFIFTLHNGIFKTIESYKDYFSSFDRISKPSIVSFKKFGSGYEVLNKNLNGGLSDHSIVLIEYTSQISVREVMIFLLKFINESIKKSFSIFVDSALIESYDFVKELNTDSFNKFISNVVFFQQSKINSFPEDNTKNVTLSTSLVEELNKRESESPKFGIIDLDSYEKIDYTKVSNLLKNTLNISFIIKKFENSFNYSNIADYHLELSLVDGIFFIKFDYPLSNIYVLEIKNNKSSGNLIDKIDLNQII